MILTDVLGGEEERERKKSRVEIDVVGAGELPRSSAFAANPPLSQSKQSWTRVPWDSFAATSVSIVLVWFASVIWTSMEAFGFEVFRWDDNPESPMDRMAFSHWRYKVAP